MMKQTICRTRQFMIAVFSRAVVAIILIALFGCTPNLADESQSSEASPTILVTIPTDNTVITSDSTPDSDPVATTHASDPLQLEDSPVARTSPEVIGCPIPPHLQVEYKGVQSNPVFAWSLNSKEIGLTVTFGYQQSAIFHFAVEEVRQTGQVFSLVAPSKLINEYDFSWSPDSYVMAFVLLREAGIGNTAYKTSDIYLMNLEDGTRTLLVEGEHYWPNAAPRWSPDGQTIAFIPGEYGRLHAVPTSGGESVQLSTVFARHHSWSPDSPRLVYTGFVPMKSPPNFSDSYLHIYVVGADGFNEQNLTLDSPCSLVPNWSPDGEKILFESYRNEQWDLYLMRSDGTGLINLTDDSRYDFDGDWSPDGQQIVFASYDLSPEIYDPAWANGSDQELFLASANGSEIVQLTDTPDQFELLPAWSPDGQYIAFLTFDENWDLHLDLVRPDGGERFRLVSFPVTAP